MSKSKAIIVSGYFNPLHKGHIELFHNAKLNGEELFVIVNNDFQRSLKKSKQFMLEQERVLIVSELSIVDRVFLAIDKDRSVCDTLKMISKDFSNNHNLYFANGGDQNNESIPEAIICGQLGIGLIENLGAKIQSSSWLLKK